MLAVPRKERYQLGQEKGKPQKDVKKGRGGKNTRGKSKAVKEEKTEVVEEAKEFVKPKSQDNPMNELRDFLRHLESDRVKREILNKPYEQPRVRDEEELGQIREEGGMAQEDGLGQLVKSEYALDSLKRSRAQIMDDNSKNLDKLLESVNSEMQANKQTFDAIDAKLKEHITQDKSLLEKLNQEEPEITLQEIDEAIQAAEEGKADSRLVEIAKKFRKNIYIKETITKLTEALETYNMEDLKVYMDRVDNEEILIDEDLRDKVEDLFIHVEENPNYIQEKLQELKKASKGRRR